MYESPQKISGTMADLHRSAGPDGLVDTADVQRIVSALGFPWGDDMARLLVRRGYVEDLRTDPSRRGPLRVTDLGRDVATGRVTPEHG